MLHCTGGAGQSPVPLAVAIVLLVVGVVVALPPAPAAPSTTAKPPQLTRHKTSSTVRPVELEMVMAHCTVAAPAAGMLR